VKIQEFYMQASLSPFIALRCVPGIDIWLQTWAFHCNMYNRERAPDHSSSRVAVGTPS